MTTLYQLAGAALLGTQRSHFELKDLPLNLQLSALSSEAQWLAAAGTLSLYEQTGQLPQRLKQPNLVVPQDDVVVISSIASRYLQMMLEGGFSDLLPEFLLTIKATNQRLPEVFLPSLLERAKNMYSHRELIQPVLGKTGLWLAQQNPAWGFATGLSWETAKPDWESTVMLIRQAIIKQARVEVPSLGRDLIESSWKRESPTDRTWILKSLRVGLSMNDEPFLEMALDDRSHTVRKLAAEVLSALPESRLSKRIEGVAKHCFNLSQRLEYSAPEMTAQLSRDGISQPNWSDPERVKASQIVDFVSLIHLDFWSTPKEFIQAAMNSPYTASYITGLSSAIERQNNLRWAKALLIQTNYTANALKLVSLLELSDIEELIRKLPEIEGPLNVYPATRIFGRWPKPWSDAMTMRWLGLLQRQGTHHPEEKLDSSLETVTKYMARFCPGHLIAETYTQLEMLSAFGLGFGKLCLEPLLILEFRKKMLEALGDRFE